MNKYQKQISKAAKKTYKIFGLSGRYDLFYRDCKREYKRYEKFRRHERKIAKALMIGLMKGLGL
ncbi:hypothetical protein Ccar_16700 [Clostridium carboxidivorans P7]|uniref:hypothetical protein n=1 Tax=Clostridium carboxidivorans TaxID=217159 RepID=UPI00064FE232|nr:hypothetical protein [Clostridium carboxidivorans]AKN32409.1 hypothetical protein Ccar_16700 [Clostridium carboxidivorans P7]